MILVSYSVYLNKCYPIMNAFVPPELNKFPLIARLSSNTNKKTKVPWYLIPPGRRR